MKIIYIDQLGCYAALVAALVRCGIFEGDGEISELRNCPGFAANRNMRPGNLYYAGRDNLNNEVYALGVGKEAVIIQESAGDLFAVLGLTEVPQIIDVSRFNPFLLKWIWTLNLLPNCGRLTVFIAALLLNGKIPSLYRLAGKRLNN